MASDYRESPKFYSFLKIGAGFAANAAHVTISPAAMVMIMARRAVVAATAKEKLHCMSKIQVARNQDPREPTAIPKMSGGQTQYPIR